MCGCGDPSDLVEHRSLNVEVEKNITVRVPQVLDTEIDVVVSRHTVIALVLGVVDPTRHSACRGTSDTDGVECFRQEYVPPSTEKVIEHVLVSPQEEQIVLVVADPVLVVRTE